MRKEGKSGKSERRKRNRKLMANLVSNYKNFKGESAPAKMAILDGTSTMDSMITINISYVQRIENGSLGRKRR